jgi:hypothetical protein
MPEEKVPQKMTSFCPTSFDFQQSWTINEQEEEFELQEEWSRNVAHIGRGC